MSWEEIEQLIQEVEFYSALPRVLKLLCTETSAGRCNFWFVEDKSLVPVYNYDAERNEYTLEGLGILDLNLVPKYYQSLLKNSILFLEDVNKDSKSSELSEIYWKPFNIQSSVDFILRCKGNVVGVMCVEFKYKKSFSEEDKKRLKNFRRLLEKSYWKNLRLEEFSFKSLFEQVLNLPDISVVITNKSGIIRFVNETFKKITGYSAFEVLNRKTSILKSGHHPQEFYKGLWDTILAGKVWSGTIINRRKNGEIYYERKSIMPVKTKNKGIVGFLSLGYEVTEEVKLQKVKFIFEELTKIMNTYDDEYNLLEKTCEVLYKVGGYNLVWIGKRVGTSVDVMCAQGAKEYLRGIKIVLEEQSPLSKGPTGRAFLMGERVAFNDFEKIPNYVPWRDRTMGFGFRSSASIPIKVKGIVEYTINLYSSERDFFTDDELKILEELSTNLGLVLEKLVMKKDIFRKEFYDELTGLPNRKLFLEELDYEIELAKNYQKGLCLLIVDIFNFSLINTTYGTILGNRILLAFIEKVKDLYPEANLFARSGADEFAIAIFFEKDIEHILSMVGLLREVDVEVDDLKIKLYTNVGIAVYPKDAESGKFLFDKAMVALKKSKEYGRGYYCLYDSSLEVELKTKLDLERDILSALENGEFFLYYQPIADTGNLNLVGVEALIHWYSPKSGFVSPATFIPIAESMDLIRDIDVFVLRSVQKFFHKLKNSGCITPKISVNLTPTNFEILKEFFNDENFMKHLDVELTERGFFEVFKYEETLHKFLELGGSLSIDDFGTGYSSLSYLSELPARCIKIDMSFVRKIVEDEKTKRIVEAIVEIGKTFGMLSLAEGVETEEQFNILRKLGCDEFQGYFYSPPLSEEEIIDKFLKIKK